MKTLKIILIGIGFVCWIFAFIEIAYADQTSICIKKCKADVMNVDQCIQEEKDFWDSKNISDYHFKLVCKDLIKHEKIECYTECREDE